VVFKDLSLQRREVDRIEGKPIHLWQACTLKLRRKLPWILLIHIKDNRSGEEEAGSLPPAHRAYAPVGIIEVSFSGMRRSIGFG